MQSNNDLELKAKELKNEYYREWRKSNRDKVKATQDRYWLKKARDLEKN